jgi:streptogramin lyase
MTPSGSYTIYTVPGATGEGVGITSGHDGNVWALIENGSAPAMIARVKPATGEMTVFTLPGDILGVDNNRIISAPSGELWYTRNSAAPTQYIGRISLTGHIFERLYPTPDRFVSFLGGLAYGNDGNIWFSQTNPVQDGVGVFERHIIDVDPPRVKLRGVGQSTDVTVTEKYHAGGWSAVTSDPSVATVAQGRSSNVFTIGAVGAGTAIVTISDSKDNDFEVPVTVI